MKNNRIFRCSGVQAFRAVLISLLLLQAVSRSAAQNISPTRDQLSNYDMHRFEANYQHQDIDIKISLEEGLQERKIIDRAKAALKEHPHPIRTIRSAGLLAKDPIKIETQKALRDMAKIEALGYTDLLLSPNLFDPSASTRYRERARIFILAWARTNRATGAPIDETNLEPLLFGYDLTRSTFPDAGRKETDRWLRSVAQAEIASRDPRRGTAVNNWNSHRIKIVGLIGYVINDGDLVQYAIKAFEQQVKDDLNPDGSSLDFHDRDALHYHCYTLEPLLTFARIAELHHYPLYQYQAENGASLAKSVHFLIPYAEGRLTHAEFVHSTAAFDRKRAEAGQAEYQSGRLFQPKEAAKALELASFFEPDLTPLVVRLLGGKAKQFPNFEAIVIGAQRDSIQANN